MDANIKIYADADGAGYWIYLVGFDNDGYPFSRKIAWFDTKENAENYMDQHKNTR